MPSTHSATITMVANTGLLIETRVIHMLRSSLQRAFDDAGGRGHRAKRPALARATTVAFAPSRRLSKRAASTCAVGVRPVSTSTRPLRLVAPAGRDGAAHQRAVLDHPHMVLPRGAGRSPATGTVRRCAGSAQHHACQRVLAGAKRLVRVRQRHRHADRARAGLGRRRDARRSAGRPAAPRLRPHLHRHARARGATPRACPRCRPARASPGRRWSARLLHAELFARHHMALGDHARDRRHQRRLAQADARSSPAGPARR